MTKRKKPKTDAAPAIADRLLTLREAVDVLRLSTRTMRDYVQRGEIEGRLIGGRWRFRRADLDAFFANAPRSWDFAGKNSHGAYTVDQRKQGRGWNGHFLGFWARLNCENMPIISAWHVRSNLNDPCRIP
jgi:excisionase family DNA binding protein